MNHKKITTKLNINLITLVLITIIITINACSIGGFNQSTAAGLLEEDSRYKAPATMTIDIGGKLANAQAKTPQISPDDTEEAAIIRAKEDFAERHAAIIVAEKLGYIKFHLEKAELVYPQPGMPGSGNDLKMWKFHPRAEITEKGKKLWTDLGLNVNEQSLPLAVRETLEITKIEDSPRYPYKIVNFTYGWKPNELGKSFEADSDEFKKLSAKLQEQLGKKQRTTFGGGVSNLMNFKNKKTGVVRFDKIENGWQLNQVIFN